MSRPSERPTGRTPWLATPHHGQPLFVLVALGLMALGASHAIRLVWVTDDAFISFRYAENLLRGAGLVYNVGERVEGYSNFLWTLWCAAGVALGVDPVPWSLGSGIACYAGTLGLLATFTAARARHRAAISTASVAAGFTVPVATLLGAVHRDWAIFASSGLETSLFTLLAVAGYLLTLGAPGRPLRSALAGSVLALAALTRPDGILLGVVGGVFVLVKAPRRPSALLAFAAPLVLLLVPYGLWKLAYYGDLLPNTYHAKSAGRSWWSQGWIYVGLYFAKYWIVGLGAVLCGVAALLRRGAASRSGPGNGEAATRDSRENERTTPSRRAAQRIPAASPSTSPGRAEAPTSSPALPDSISNGIAWGPAAALAAGFALVYTCYVARVGGDFMFARLLVPVTPFWLLLAELGFERVVPGAATPRVAIAAIMALAVAFTPYPFRGQGWVRGIVNEWEFYTRRQQERSRRFGLELRRMFEGLPVRVAFCGGQAVLAYYSRAPLAIETATGLTDSTIAHQPLGRRGRPGHEKTTPVPYLISRGTHFWMYSGSLLSDSLAGYIPLIPIKLDTLTVMAITWDPPVMDSLRARGAQVPDFLATLDEFIRIMPALPDSQVRAVYEKTRRFYFDHARDPEREARFRARLGASG